MTATQLKEQLLKETGAFDADAYREDIRGLADKYGTKYKETYEEIANFGGANKDKINKKKIFIAIALLLVVAGGGTYFYFSKMKLKK